MEKDSRIFVAGHNGLVGSAIFRKLRAGGYRSLIFRNHSELDLARQADVENFFFSEKPEYVFLAAAKVGGIWANNSYPAEFIYSNLAVQTHVIHAAWENNVKRLVFLGSSCIYPKECPQPMKEDHLLTGKLEPTNEPYAIAKIAGVKICQSYNRQYNTKYLAVMPTNLYGPNDNFDPETSHVLPALIRKFHEAKVCNRPVGIWGTGNPRREFLHVDDLADAVIFLMNMKENIFNPIVCPPRAPLINIGYGKDISIRELAELIKEIVKFDGPIFFEPGHPDGMLKKLLDSSEMGKLGWKPKITLPAGIKNMYEWCLKQEIFSFPTPSCKS
ncbi:MAG: GDP-L-fucose synthase [Desulfobacterales bacterium]|nr:GDP-L-fucose synthase [Desulfobacterales bacterium]